MRATAEASGVEVTCTDAGTNRPRNSARNAAVSLPSGSPTIATSIGEVAKWFLWHVAELDLYVAVLPFAAFLLLGVAACLRSAAHQDRIYLAVSAPTVFWLALLVATFASQPSVQRIEEYLRGQGYRDATAAFTREPAGDELVVRFTV